MAGRFPLIAHFLGQARKYFFALVFETAVHQLVGSNGWALEARRIVAVDDRRNLIKNFIEQQIFPRLARI